MGITEATTFLNAKKSKRDQKVLLLGKGELAQAGVSQELTQENITQLETESADLLTKMNQTITQINTIWGTEFEEEE